MVVSHILLYIYVTSITSQTHIPITSYYNVNYTDAKHCYPQINLLEQYILIKEQSFFHLFSYMSLFVFVC